MRADISSLLLIVFAYCCRDVGGLSSIQVTWADAYKSLPPSHTTKILEFVTVKHSAHDIYVGTYNSSYVARRSIIVETMEMEIECCSML